MKLDLTKKYIDLETVNKFIEYNSDLSDVKPIPEPHLDVVFMSYNEKDADKHYELLKKRVPSAKRVNGVKGILNAYNACRELAETPLYFIVEGDSMICKDFKFKLPIEWLQSIASLDHNELNYDYVKARHCITWNSINPVNGEIGTHSPIGLAFKSDSLYNWKCDTNFNIPYNYINDIDSKESIKSIEADSFKCQGIRSNAIASVDFFNSSPYDAWKTGFRMGNRLTFRLLNLNSNLKETEERFNHWTTVGEEQKNGKYCIEGVTYGIKCATICTNWIEEYRNTSDNYDWLKETFEREYGTQYNTN
jgi:hypothetical protein